MGLLDTVGRLTGKRLPRSGDALLDAFLRLVAADGGIGGLLGRFNAAGLAAKAHSWVASGENEPLEPDEVERVIGRDRVEELSRETELSRADVKQGLAGMIPRLVDAITPKGSLPTGDFARSLKQLDLARVTGG